MGGNGTSIEDAVGELVNAGFREFGGTGDAEPYIIREKRMQQQSLFALPERPQPTPMDKRRKAAQNAFNKANPEWVEEYTRFVLEFAEKAIEPFSAEDVRLAYEKSGKPSTHADQASGGIFLRLRREGKLKMVGSKKSVKFGNLLSTYLKA